MKKKLPLKLFLTLCLVSTGCIKQEPVLTYCTIVSDNDGVPLEAPGAWCAKKDEPTKWVPYSELKDYISVSADDFLRGRKFITELERDLARCKAGH